MMDSWGSALGQETLTWSCSAVKALTLCFGGLSDTRVVVTVRMDGFYSRLMTIRSVRKIYTLILLVSNYFLMSTF